MNQSDPHQPGDRFLTLGPGVVLLFAVLLLGLPLANAYLAPQADSKAFLPVVQREPSPTPTPTPTPLPYYYTDGFDDENSGWPEINNPDPQDCYHFYYGESDYRLDICDDRTTHTASPWVELPPEDYVIEFDSRFRGTGGWAHAYGVYFDGNNAPDSVKDYIVFRFLWEGSFNHSWSLIRFEDGQKVAQTAWIALSELYYNYGSDGTALNHWKMIRRADAVQLFCNGTYLGQVNYTRPTGDDYFGVYGSTWELRDFYVAWDDYTVYPLAGSASAWQEPIVVPFMTDPSGLEPNRPAPRD